MVVLDRGGDEIGRSLEQHISNLAAQRHSLSSTLHNHETAQVEAKIGGMLSRAHLNRIPLSSSSRPVPG